jgi:hypothetical protein
MNEKIELSKLGGAKSEARIGPKVEQDLCARFAPLGTIVKAKPGKSR